MDVHIQLDAENWGPCEIIENMSLDDAQLLISMMKSTEVHYDDNSIPGYGVYESHRFWVIQNELIYLEIRLKYVGDNE